MVLEQYGEGLAVQTAFWLQGLRDPQYPVAQLGALSLELSARFRTLAILVLLVKGSTDAFAHHLIRSGRCRLTYLERLRAMGITDDHHLATGRREPLIDAIASGDFELARNIAALSPSEWHEDREYQDDYCYARILSIFLGGQSEDALPALLASFSGSLEGMPSPRLAICQALADKDSDAFAVAFADLLQDRSLEIVADKKRGRLEEPDVIAERHVFIEGLALLRLAESRGLATETHYLYCPSLAREAMRTPFPGE